MEAAAARTLATVVGAAIANTRVYGAAHRVTGESVGRAAAEAASALEACGRLDIVVHAQRLFVNAAVVEPDISPIQTFRDCLLQLEVQSLSIPAPLYRSEFEAFLRVLTATREEAEAAGGFGALLMRAGLARMKVGRMSVRAVDETDEKPAAQPETAKPQRQAKPVKTGAKKSFDLSEELAALNNVAEAASSDEDGNAVAGLNAVVNDLKARVRADAALAGGASTRELTEALQRVERAILELIRQTERKVGGLVANVEADRPVVERIEREARERGVPLHVTREALLTGLSEVVQESYQPLSVVDGAVELLRSGRLGAVTDAQREMLDAMADGMGRLGKLVGFLRKISGVPESLTPDKTILGEAYS
jgi:hypothetical protein